MKRRGLVYRRTYDKDSAYPQHARVRDETEMPDVRFHIILNTNVCIVPQIYTPPIQRSTFSNQIRRWTVVRLYGPPFSQIFWQVPQVHALKTYQSQLPQRNHGKLTFS